MLLQIHPDNPDKRKIKIVVDCLKSGGTIIYPTDTVYGWGCDIFNHKAVEKICKAKGIDPEKHNMTMVCNNISQITEYVMHLDNQLFTTMKQCVPGPYTFILKASKEVPRLFKNKRKTIGIRIPENRICQTLIEELTNPILSTSIHDEDEMLDYIIDPEMIYEKFNHLVDIVIDGGSGGNVASTILDCTTNPIQIVREGLGSLDLFQVNA